MYRFWSGSRSLKVSSVLQSLASHHFLPPPSLHRQRCHRLHTHGSGCSGMRPIPMCWLRSCKVIIISLSSCSVLPHCTKLFNIAMCRLVSWLAGGRCPIGRMYQRGPANQREAYELVKETFGVFFHLTNLICCVDRQKQRSEFFFNSVSRYLLFLPLCRPSPLAFILNVWYKL